MKIATRTQIEMMRQGLLNSEWCGFSKRETVNDLCDLAIKGLQVDSRPEEANLRAALAEFCEAFRNRGETTSLHEWGERLKAVHANALEALAGRLPYAEPVCAPQQRDPA